MTFDELHGEYMKICNNQEDCAECKYYNKYPCQLAFGYDKGRKDAIDEFVERLSKTDINASNYPMNQITLVKMQILKEEHK